MSEERPTSDTESFFWFQQQLKSGQKVGVWAVDEDGVRRFHEIVRWPPPTEEERDAQAR